MPTLSRRLRRAAVGWVLTVGLAAVAVHPESCGTPTDAELTTATESAVQWFAANLQDNGDFVYRYDRDRGEIEPGYNDTRHAGVLWALWQAERAGYSGAGETADAAFTRVERRLVDTVIGPAFGVSQVVPSGAVGLLVAALDERRLATGSTDKDDALLAFGHTLRSVVHADGSVSANISVVSGPGTERSPFFTGEVMWALARLHLTFPDEGFDQPALAIRGYLVNERERIERPWPPLSDHWAAYAFETMDRWPDPPSLTASEDEWLDRQLALFGLQVRYESQRRGGVTRLTRGSIALAAGVGTLGEGIGNHLLHLRRAGNRPKDVSVLTERIDCAAHLLVQRQITTGQSAADSAPGRTAGAWFRLGDTQMDDQQHALSALLVLADVRRQAQSYDSEAP